MPKDSNLPAFFNLHAEGDESRNDGYTNTQRADRDVCEFILHQASTKMPSIPPWVLNYKQHGKWHASIIRIQGGGV
jgi:hypothetical protein